MMKDDDFKLFWGFADGLTDEQTFVNVESLLRLKERKIGTYICNIENLIKRHLLLSPS